MRLAVLSDIHGNPYALDAVLADIDAVGGVDEYWVNGDLVAIGPEPVATLERLIALPRARFTRGNTDRYTVDGSRPRPTRDQVRADPSLLDIAMDVQASFALTQGAIASAGYLPFLAELPLEIRTSMPSGLRLLAVHASPGADDSRGVYPGQPEPELRELMAGADAHAVFVGHTHGVVSRRVDDVLVINPGSVSNHMGEDVTAKYAMVTISDDEVDVNLRGVAYDNDAALAALDRFRHPARDFIARMLRGEKEPWWIEHLRRSRDDSLLP